MKRTPPSELTLLLRNAQKRIFNYNSAARETVDPKTGRRRLSFCEVPGPVLGLATSTAIYKFVKQEFIASGIEGSVYRFVYEGPEDKNLPVTQVAIKVRTKEDETTTLLETKLHVVLNGIGGYALSPNDSREFPFKYYTLMKFVEGVTLKATRFRNLAEYLDFSINLMTKLGNLHLVATHNDLTSSNIMLQSQLVDFIDFSKAKFVDAKMDAKTSFDLDLGHLKENLFSHKPENLENLSSEYKKIIMALDQVIAVAHEQPLAVTLAKYKKIANDEAFCRLREPFNNLKDIFFNVLGEEKYLGISILKPIQELFAKYSEQKEDLGNAADVVLGAIIIARNQAKTGYQPAHFKAEQGLVKILDEVIKQYTQYLVKQHVVVHPEQFFIDKYNEAAVLRVAQR